jgi:hypothetical protein
MKITLPKLTTLALLLVSFLLSAPSALAQEVSLVLSPPRLDLEGKPGDILQKTLKITNNSSDQKLSLKAVVSDFIVQDDSGTPLKVEESASGRYLASPWFTLEKTDFILDPKETAQIVVIITIPQDALPGGHYAGVFFEPTPVKGLKDTVSYTSAQVGSLFGITVAGNIKYDALIRDFKVSSEVSEFGPVDFTAVIENQSDTHIRPVAQIIIRDMFGRKLTEFPLDQVNIFPFASRALQGTWDTVWGLGRYTATLTATYGPGLVATRSLYFWIMPYTLIMAFAVVILTLIVLIIAVRRHLKHRQDHRDEEIDNLKRRLAEMENKSA